MSDRGEPVLLSLLYDLSVVAWILFLLFLPVLVAVWVSGCAAHGAGPSVNDASSDAPGDSDGAEHVWLAPWCPDPSPVSTCPPGKPVTGEPPLPPDQQ